MTKRKALLVGMLLLGFGVAAVIVSRPGVRLAILGPATPKPTIEMGKPPTIAGVSCRLPGGKSYVKSQEHGIALPAVAAKDGLTFEGTGDLTGIKVRLGEWDPMGRTVTPICDLPATPLPGTKFRIEVPKERVGRGMVYRIVFENPETGEQAKFGFTISSG